MTGTGPTVAKLFVYPIKSLSAVSVEELEFLPVGRGIRYDREWALYNKDGRYVNGKTCPLVHLIKLTRFEPPSTVWLSLDNSQVTFDLVKEKKAAENWLNKALQRQDLQLVRKGEDTAGQADDPRFDGPTVVSVATLETVNRWMDITDALARFRPNILVDGVPPFWEDSLVDDRPTHGKIVGFERGAVELIAIAPCHRCVVPTRNSETGESTPSGFIVNFSAKRVENLAPWSPTQRLTHGEKGLTTNKCYNLCTNCQVLRPGFVAVGEGVVLSQDFEPIQPAVTGTRDLSVRSLRVFLDRAYAIGNVPKHLYILVYFLTYVLPLPIVAKVVTDKANNGVRKPTSSEIRVGLAKMVGAVAAVGIVIFFATR